MKTMLARIRRHLSGLFLETPTVRNIKKKLPNTRDEPNLVIKGQAKRKVKAIQLGTGKHALVLL